MAQYDLLLIEDIGVTTEFAEKIVSITRGGLLTASADANRVPRWLAVGSSGQILSVDANGDLVWVAGAADAFIFKGAEAIATVAALTTYSVGWTYRATDAGSFKGQTVEIGDLLIAVVARTGSGNADADWTVAQNNIDGAVIGPASAVDNNLCQFNLTTGKLIEDSGLSNTDVSNAVSLKHAAVTITAGGGLVLSTQALSMWSSAPAAYNSDCSAVGIMAYDGNYWYIGITAGSAGSGRWARIASAKTW